MDDMTITRGPMGGGEDKEMCWDTLDGHTEDSLEQ